MKLFTYAFVALTWTLTSANAAFMPGAEQAVYSADLSVDNASGALERVERVGLVRIRTEQAPQERFELRINGVFAGRFRIVMDQDLGCGSHEAIAEEMPTAEGSRNGIRKRLVVTDHSDRYCKDMIVKPLRVNLSVGELGHGIVGDLSADGTPVPMVNIL